MIRCASHSLRRALRRVAGPKSCSLKLRRHGYPVSQVHTNAGREFDNAPFKQWCMERGFGEDYELQR